MEIRWQVQGLCRLIAKYAQNAGGDSCNANSTKNALAAMEELRTCFEKHILAEEEHTKVVQCIEELSLAFAIFSSQEDPLGQQWARANSSFKSLKQQGKVVEADHEKEGARILRGKTKDLNNKQEVAELVLKKVEGEELLEVEKKLEATNNLLEA